MSDRVLDALDRANPGSLPTNLQRIKIGHAMAGLLPQQIIGAVPAAQTNELATLIGLGLPYESRAAKVSRAIVRTVSGGAVLGELTPVAYGATPGTGEVAVSPSGDVVFLAADLATKIDVYYQPVEGEIVEWIGPVATGVLTLPAQITSRHPILLLEAEALTVLSGVNVGRKIVLVPASAATATTKAALAIDRSKVYFNDATDHVATARVKLLVAHREQHQAALYAEPKST